jgi:hypothetical protein
MISKYLTTKELFSNFIKLLKIICERKGLQKY